MIKSNTILINSAVSVIRPKNAGPDGQLRRSWQPSAASARSFVKAQLSTAQVFVYHALRKSYTVLSIQQLLIQERVVKGLALQQYHGSTPSISISQGDEINTRKKR
jgi:hypothetical protein